MADPARLDDAVVVALGSNLAGDFKSSEALLEAALARFPQAALRSDRMSAIEQWELGWQQATLNEFRLGIATVATGETEDGARRFAAGAGRHGVAAT